MKSLATILALGSGVILSLGKDPRSLMALGVILLVCITWVYGLAGKKAFDREFWLSLLILLLIPFIICQIILAIGWPILILLIIVCTIFISFDLKRTRKAPFRTKGIERAPIFPADDHDDY